MPNINHTRHLINDLFYLRLLSNMFHKAVLWPGGGWIWVWPAVEWLAIRVARTGGKLRTLWAWIMLITFRCTKYPWTKLKQQTNKQTNKTKQLSLWGNRRDQDGFIMFTTTVRLKRFAEKFCGSHDGAWGYLELGLGCQEAFRSRVKTRQWALQ